MTQNGIIIELQEGGEGKGKGLTELTELELGGGCTEYFLLLSIYKV